jgi:precorrin-4/cobalt-precorrin-4 C11-methyltransferase
MTESKGKVYIIGAGPGDPELLTLKAKRIIESSDLVIFADSLVPPQIVEFAKEGAQVIGSSELNLDQIMELELNAVREGKIVARVQSGDPSIYRS